MTKSRIFRTHRSAPRLWPAIGLGLLLLPASAASAQQPDIAGITQREVALVEFYGGGSPLSAQEQQETADMVQREMQSAPRAEQAADADAKKLLAALRQAQPQLIALARSTGRLNAQLHEVVSPELKDQQALEAQIIAAHDPVIVFDPAHKQLVSEQTIHVLQQADAFGAAKFGVPAPGADFPEQMRQAIPRAWPDMDSGMKEAMAHAERDLPYAPGFLQGINPQKWDSFAATWRAKIMAAPDAAGQQLNLAEVMAVVGMTGYRRSGSGGGGGGGTQAMLSDRLMRQNLLQHQLMGAMRSYSPMCNVTRPDYNFASCHP